MTISTFFLQFWQFLTIDDNFHNSDNCFCHFDNWKDNPGDLWHIDIVMIVKLNFWPTNDLHSLFCRLLSFPCVTSAFISLSFVNLLSPCSTLTKWQGQVNGPTYALQAWQSGKIGKIVTTIVYIVMLAYCIFHIAYCHNICAIFNIVYLCNCACCILSCSRQLPACTLLQWRGVSLVFLF